MGVVRTISLTWITEIGLFLVSKDERLDLEKGWVAQLRNSAAHSDVATLIF